MIVFAMQVEEMKTNVSYWAKSNPPIIITQRTANSIVQPNWTMGCTEINRLVYWVIKMQCGMRIFDASDVWFKHQKLNIIVLSCFVIVRALILTMKEWKRAEQEAITYLWTTIIRRCSTNLHIGKYLGYSEQITNEKRQKGFLCMFNAHLFLGVDG